MARVFYGDDHVFNAMLYDDDQVRRSRRIIREQFEDDEDLRGASSRLRDRISSLRDRFEDEELLHRTRAAVRKITGVHARDDYRPLSEVLDFQQAKSKMRSSIMACPEIRELVRKQRIEGYRDYYTDPGDDVATEDMPMYRRIVTGFVESDDEGNAHFINYADEELDEDDPDFMESFEQFEVMDTWAKAIMLLRTQDRDITSTVNNPL